MEASVQFSSTPLRGEEPFIGDLAEGEPLVNTSDGRFWVGGSNGVPVELGGAAKDRPMGDLYTSNYYEVDLSSPDNLPIANTDPLLIPPGIYREARILIKFSETPQVGFQSYFDFVVDWGLESNWKIHQENIYNDIAENPIDYYKDQGRVILVELSSFGPNPSWKGRVLWVNSI